MNRICSIGDFYNYAGRHSHLSFDLFDTLIRRALLKVNEVHDTVSAYALTQIGKRRTSSPFDLTLLRYRMTDVLKSSEDGGNQEPLIDLVWDRLLQRDVPDARERAGIVERIVSFELELELRNLRLVPGAAELLARLKHEGRTVVAISDMYFDLARMETILRTLGIRDHIDHLYVSAEAQRTKQTGDLFRHVLDDLRIKPSQMVHAGDNLRSDVERATEAGISAVLVDQPQLLEIERPAYGRRTRIEEEVADLVKLHLFSLLLDAQDRKLDQIYFMARDGCAIGSFLARWPSPLIERFMPVPAQADLYLNRILSCWGGIDFAGEWLRQAVDLALWLHHDAATPDELCAMLGVDDVPPALGSATLRAGPDSARIVGVLTEAKLLRPIKAAIIARRAELVRYLQDAGFFDRRAVAFSDVGYTGTVVRDLNNLFLNRAAEEGVLHPPAMLLTLMATADNWAANRSRAYPFVEFSPQAVLPADKLPPELKASFAWLEFFFKHPTLLPILRFVERDGRVTPELRHGPALPEPVPSQRVADYAVERDEDIVLLWMAALNFTGQIVDPVIHRFANPDPDTIAQMQDEVFEQHSVLGTRRSIFLTIPGARVEAISLAAQKGDYWLPGSIAVSGAAPRPARDADSPPPRRRGWSRWLRPSRAASAAAPVAMPDGFDPAFYRAFYADLRQFTTPGELAHHYRSHGRAEKRLPTREALVAQLEAEFGAIPEDFDGRAYLRLNADLGTRFDSPVQALDHYMRFGRHEGRPYLNHDPDLPDAFERLRAAGAIVLTDGERARWTKGEAVMTLFLRRHEVRAGAWLNDLDVAEFRALHHDWCGPVDSAAACIVALLERGMARTPSLSLHTPFDRDYYRQQSAELELLEAEDLYRHYLNHASSEGLQPSEQAALRQIWGHSEFPGCFSWTGYRAQVPALTTAARAAVLAAFIDDPDPKRLAFVDGEDAASFLQFLGIRAWRHHGRVDEARSILQAALDAGGGVGPVQHLLGDMALQLGQPDRALAHFRLGAAAPDADLWSSYHLARLLLEQGDHRSALIALSASASAWQERAPWRRLWAAAMQARAEATLRHVLAPGNELSALDEADALMADIAARVPATYSEGGGTGVLVITSRPVDAAAREAWSGVTIANAGDGAGGDLVGALLAHAVVIFHEAPFSHPVLRTIALARSLGKRTVAWFGDLADWDGHRLGGLLAGGGASALRPDNLPGFALPARYCDRVVTRLAGCAPLLARVAPDRELEVIAPAPGNYRGADPAKRVVLVAPDVDGDVADVVARAVAEAAGAEARLFFLLPEPVARRPALRAIAGRWAAVDDLDLPDLARLIGTVDAVLYAQDEDRAGYRVETEAAARGVPTVAVPAPPPAKPGARASEAAPASASDLAAAIVRTVGTRPTPPLAIKPHRPPAPHATSAPATRPTRLLFANIFFAPQVIGGATRVLKDNIDYLLDHHRDAFDLAVFTADEQNDTDGEWRIDAYRGMPVFRVATPQELNMDWRAANAAVGAKLRALLAAFQPDLVHIHCLQRLSVTVAEACRASGVRYIVTLHDAWWISDFPFLTDDLGMPAPARPDYYDQERLRGVGIARSALRGERLRSALLGAERRLAVSERFAEVYRAAGIACETVENGTSRIAPVPRAAPGERVELCHIGGLQHHKGAYLIEAALRSNSYAHLHFTVVDLARGPGQRTDTVWGTTPVTITGKMSTAELACFYAGMNVLLAPSTWPESYGLVSREALSHGLWVIAGNNGAMADPVVEGVNGFVVATADPGELAQVLRTIDRDAATYRLPPRATGTMRTADDQSRDLVSLYRMLAAGDATA